MSSIRQIDSYEDYATEIGRVITLKAGNGLSSLERRRLINELVLLLKGQLFAPYVKEPHWKDVDRESISRIVEQAYEAAETSKPNDYLAHLSSLPDFGQLRNQGSHIEPSPKFNLVACNYRGASVKNGRETEFVVNKDCLAGVGFGAVKREHITDFMRTFFQLYFEIFPKPDTFNEAILSRDREGAPPLAGLGFVQAEVVNEPVLHGNIRDALGGDSIDFYICVLPYWLRNLLVLGKKNSGDNDAPVFERLYESFISTWEELTANGSDNTKTEEFQSEVVARCLDRLREKCFLSTRLDYVEKAHNYLVENGTEADRIALQKTMGVIYGKKEPYASKLKSYLSLLQGVVCFLELAQSSWIWTVPLDNNNDGKRPAQSVTMIGDMDVLTGLETGPPFIRVCDVWSEIWETVKNAWRKAFTVLPKILVDEGKLNEILKEANLKAEMGPRLEEHLQPWCHQALLSVLRIASKIAVAFHEGRPLRFQGIVGRGGVAKELEMVSVESKKFSDVIQAVSVLKGNYSFLQDQDIAIFIDVDEFPNGLGVSKIVRIKSRDNSTSIHCQQSQSDALQMLAKKEDAFVFRTMSDGRQAQVFADGKEVFRYRNGRWACGRDMLDTGSLADKLSENLLSFVPSWSGEPINKLVSVLLDISNTPGEGTTIILADEKVIAEQFADMGKDSLFNLGASKTIRNVGPQVLHQMLVMDGATWIDIVSERIRPRLRLNAVAGRENPENIGSRPPWKQVDVTELLDDKSRNEWLHKGARHSSAATLVGACLGKRICVYVVSSDGGVLKLEPSTDRKIDVCSFAE